METFPDAAWDKVLDLNLKSPFWLVQALLPALREAGTADEPSRIINIGSIDGIRVSHCPCTRTQQQGGAAPADAGARQ